MLCKTVSNAFINLCYVFIVALCLSDVALVNAQTRVPPPPARTPAPVWISPPPRPLGTRVIPKKPTLIPNVQSEQPLWFNVGVITAVAALITGIAALIRSLRKGG
jgi:hypothetical protein